MGNIRTPKLKYFENGVVTFYVMDKTVYFKIWLWLKDGLKQFEYMRGKYKSDEQINELVNQALQSFSNVGVIENWEILNSGLKIWFIL